MRLSTFAHSLAGALVASLLASAAGCARSAEERQLDDMRAEIDRIQETRDREDRAAMAPEVADSNTPTMPAPGAPPQAPAPADQDAVTLGSAPPGAAIDDYADTDDPTPRPNIRVLGSARPTERGSWREDRVEQTGPDEGTGYGSKLDPAAAPAYDAAMALVNAHQYEKALDSLAAFLVRWPEHPYANNAMYWRGECYFARGDYRRAAEQFEGVVARFPAGAKAPDALLKLGMSQQRLGDPVKARDSFDRLTQLYPQSDAARRIPPVTATVTTPRGPAPEDHR